ncbi:MAG TPA: hypothetical protein ENK84_05885 [Desulfobulbus sp.]|nr:hypothetical protein [Desulfobulbus sp.]
MKPVFLFSAIASLIFLITPPAFSATNPDHIDPCGLIAKQKVFTAFPAIKAMKKQTIGPNTTCNYLNEKGFSALIVSVGRADHKMALDAIQGMGDGYSFQPISGLGDSAAVALTKGNPKFGIQGGLVAELHVIKNNSFVNLAPVRLDAQSDSPVFAVLEKLAEEMVENLP